MKPVCCYCEYSHSPINRGGGIPLFGDFLRGELLIRTSLIAGVYLRFFKWGGTPKSKWAGTAPHLVGGTKKVGGH